MKGRKNIFDLKGHHFTHNKCEKFNGNIFTSIYNFIYTLKAGFVSAHCCQPGINQHYNEETMPGTCDISR